MLIEKVTYLLAERESANMSCADQFPRHSLFPLFFETILAGSKQCPLTESQTLSLVLLEGGWHLISHSSR